MRSVEFAAIQTPSWITVNEDQSALLRLTFGVVRVHGPLRPASGPACQHDTVENLNTARILHIAPTAATPYVPPGIGAEKFMQMSKAVATFAWFARRPSYWDHAFRLGLRKFFDQRDGADASHAARAWAAERAQPLERVLTTLGLADAGESVPRFPVELRREGEQRAATSSVEMGGAADLDLLYAVATLSGARRVVETGVAFGWSSLAILAALQGRPAAALASVDMPYPRRNNEAFVGIVVPDRFRSDWSLIRAPDRRGIKVALDRLGGTIDLAHYDSDKSYQGRKFGYTALWRALRTDGIFISDDIQDNFAFRDFVDYHQLDYAVGEAGGKFIGITRKP